MSEKLNRKALEQGLTEEQAAQSKQQYGTNALAKKETESLWSMFIGAFDDIWIKVLCLALALKVVLAILGVIVPALGCIRPSSPLSRVLFPDPFSPTIQT